MFSHHDIGCLHNYQSVVQNLAISVHGAVVTDRDRRQKRKETGTTMHMQSAVSAQASIKMLFCS